MIGGNNGKTFFLWKEYRNALIHEMNRNTILIFSPGLCEAEHQDQTQKHCAQQEHHYLICVTQSSDGLVKPFHCRRYKANG